MQVTDEIRRLGGAAKACELREAGATPGRIRAALADGSIRRPRKGWYVLPGTPATLVAAVRVGGRATCVTALRHHGVWVTERPGRVHVAVHRSACELRSAATRYERQTSRRDAVVHWLDTPKPRGRVRSRLVESIPLALIAALACIGADEVHSSAESALQKGLMTLGEWGTVLAHVTLRDAPVLGTVGALSGSGLESRFVRHARRLGLQVRQQVQIGGDRVDVLIGERLVVELDGEAFHDRRADYARNARLVLAGYHVLRFDYHQIEHEWPTVEAVLLAAVARGDHLR